MWIKGAAALVLAAIAFLIGVYLEAIRATVRSVFLPVIASWTAADLYLATHPLETGLIFAFFGVAIIPALLFVQRYASILFRRRALVDLLVAEEDKVHLVTSHMKQVSFQRIKNGQIYQLPVNAPLIPSSIAVSTTMLYSFAASRYQKKKPAELHFDTDNWGAETHSFISLGGPFVNEIPNYILERNLVPDFRITDVPTAIDAGVEYTAEREAGNPSPDAPISTDYGFIIVVRNPWDPTKRKRICIVFGLWPPGTQAAFAALLGDYELSYRKYRLFYQWVVQKWDALAVVRASVSGTLVERGEIVSIRLLKPTGPRVTP